MTAVVLPDTGLLLDALGTPAEAVAEADAWLRARGADDWDVHEMDLPRQVRRVYWGGPEIGMVGPDHPEAVPAALVGLPPAWLAASPV